ncbi:type II toxin-antitoxin system RelE/ParE family toxin [Microbispora rosea]|uniref:type II toxin-antitoxin system RelE/ParE family toxin n=1 Tax=Microbispora rosea TaxID=58117 RepID=UPI00344121D9
MVARDAGILPCHRTLNLIPRVVDALVSTTVVIVRSRCVTADTPTGRDRSPEKPGFTFSGAERSVLLDEPYNRQLRGKLRELRVHLQREAVRITYWIAPGRRIVMLTVFRKQRMRSRPRSSVRGGPCSGVSLGPTPQMRSERHGGAQSLGG